MYILIEISSIEAIKFVKKINCEWFTDDNLAGPFRLMQKTMK